MKRFAIVSTLLLAVCSVPVNAAQNADSSAAPADSREGNTTELTVIVKEVRGIVQVREGDDQPWQAAKTDMKLTQGAEFRTGPRSSVVFVIPPDQTVVLDRLGTMKVLQAIKEADGKVKTDLGVKYGRTLYDIDTSSGVEHESTIRSPTNTLAVRGTNVVMSSFAGMPTTARWNQRGFNANKHSQAVFTDNANGQSVTFGGGNQDAQIRAGDTSAAQTGLSRTLLQTGGPQGKGDGALAQSQAGVKPGIAREAKSQLESTVNLAQAFNDVARPQLLRDQQIKFNIIWDAPVADVDVKVTLTNSTGGKETIYTHPAAAGGTHAVPTRTGPLTGIKAIVNDSLGGGSPNGGVEMIQSTKGAPVGTYDFQVFIAPNTGVDPVPYTLQVLKNGVEIDRFENTVTPNTPTTHQFQIPPGGGAAN